MALTQLRYFLQVYRTKNICTASAQMNVTQQAVSRQIQNLEAELSVTLFERSPRGGLEQALIAGGSNPSAIDAFMTPETPVEAQETHTHDTVIVGMGAAGISVETRRSSFGRNTSRAMRCWAANTCWRPGAKRSSTTRPATASPASRPAPTTARTTRSTPSPSSSAPAASPAARSSRPSTSPRIRTSITSVTSSGR